MNDFNKTFKEYWQESCGLISPVNAAKMLNLKGGSASIMHIWKKKKFKIYTLKNNKKKPLLGWKDYLSIEEERIKNGKINHFTENPPSLPKEKDKTLS